MIRRLLAFLVVCPVVLTGLVLTNICVVGVESAFASNKRVLCYNERTDKVTIKRKCKKSETKIDNVEQYAQLFPGVDGVVGVAGATGPQGPAGPAGPTGLAGAPGSQGAKGPDGDQGVPGPQGSQGAQGPKGIPGTPGNAGPDGGTGVVYQRISRVSAVNCPVGTPGAPKQCTWGHSCSGGNNRPIGGGCLVTNPSPNFKLLGVSFFGNGVSCKYASTGALPGGENPFLGAYVICGGSIPFPTF